MTRIYPKWWDTRLKAYKLKTKDPFYDDVRVKLEVWDGSYIYTWVDKDSI